MPIRKDPIPVKPFHGVVKPGILRPKGAVPGQKVVLRPPVAGEMSPTPLQRVEATRQWLCKLGPQGVHAAEVVVEQFHRLRAIEAFSRGLPEGDVKAAILRLIEGKLIAVKM